MDVGTPRVAAPPTAAVDVPVRSACATCGDTDLVQWLDLGLHPVTNMFPARRAEAVGMPRWPIQWLWCNRCGLAQQRHVLPDEMLFGQGYAFRTGHASAPYMHDLARFLSQIYPDGPVVEIGCNDGTLLAGFTGRRTVGFDPSPEAAQAAAAAGLDVRPEPFTRQAAIALRDEIGPAGLIIATNVLAHIADPLDMLLGVADLLDDDGVFVAEVQYLPDLLLGNAYDNLYHEHRFAYTVRSLSNMLAGADLRLTGWEQIEPHGGSLRITASHFGTREVRSRQERWLITAPSYAQGHADWLRAKLRDKVDKWPTPVGALGASAKLVTLLNWCDLGDQVSWVIDMTPAKHGRYLPGSAVPVVAAADWPPADLLFVGAWSYLPQILRGDEGYFDGPSYLASGGHLLVPVPLPTLI